MASILLDSIINDTVENFRERGADPMAVLRNQTTGSLAFANLAAALNSSKSLNESTVDEGSILMAVEMGQGERVVWILLFSLMVLVAAGGNIIVIHIVSTNKEMKSVTNYFLVNLSLADTMVSTLNVIFNFISMLNSHWPFGSIYCKISNFIAILSISASVFTLTAISCDRYNAILHPLRPRMSHRHAIGWILLIWTLSGALALPNMIYSLVVEDRLLNEQLALTCTMIWPDGRYPLSSYDHIYNIIIMVVTYLVPIVTMAILYYNVGRELWGYEAIGENVEKQARAMLAKKKIVKMMIVVVIIFALCWLPYHGFFVVNYYLPTIFQDGPLLYQRCYLFMYWLAMSNSMYNPIIIYFMNSKFRHEFKRVLCFICCCRTYTPPVKAAGDNQQLNNAATGAASRTNSLAAQGRQLSSASQQRRLATALADKQRASSKQLALGGPIEIVVTQSAPPDDTGQLDDVTPIGGKTYDWTSCEPDALMARPRGYQQRNGTSRSGDNNSSGSSSSSSERQPFLKHANGSKAPESRPASNSELAAAAASRRSHQVDANSPTRNDNKSALSDGTTAAVAAKVWI